jgi:adenylate cyclase
MMLGLSNDFALSAAVSSIPRSMSTGGRIVQTGGDSLLIVFDSIDGAVRCAVQMQQEVPIQDGDQPPDRAIRFRVGINIGDAIADGTDLHGDAVNVAARLQAECPPGGICVARAVRDHVRGRLDLAFQELGALDLKNIAYPVEAFMLRPAATLKSVERTLVNGTGDALPLPDKPSVAVLAFTNMSGDPEQEYFSDGIADDIITELSRSRSLFVIARNSGFSYKGRAVDVKQVARELGVRYVLEGSVRRSAERVRVNAQLIDAQTGNHIWAERYDRELGDIFSVQDEITVAVTTAVLPAVSDAEFRRILRKPPESLGAWEAYQRGLWHMWVRHPAEVDRAKACFEQALALDAAFAPAYSALALLHVHAVVQLIVPLADAKELASGWARRAIEIDPNDADAQATLAWVTTMSGISDECWERSSAALAMNPNSPLAHFVRGALLVSSGRPSEGRQSALNAIRLDPRHIGNAFPMAQIALSYYFERDYQSAVDAAKQALTRFPGHPLTYRYLAASLGQLGLTAEAREALRQAMEVSKAIFEFHTRARPPWHSVEDHEHMLDGLRKAGWQG